MFDPHFVGVDYYRGAIPPVGLVEVVNVYDPVAVYDVVMFVVNDNAWAENTPTALTPGAPPGWIVVPAVRRNVDVVLLV